MTRDAEFNDHKLASIYDTVNPWAADTDFYFSLPDNPPQRILDLACGTGTLANAYARRGHVVTGLDAAEPMLEIARLKDDDGVVDWVLGDARNYRSESMFDLIVMTGHAFQFLVSDDDVQFALTAMHGNLAPTGQLVFESRNPDARAWVLWDRESARQVSAGSGQERMEISDDVLAVNGDVVEVETRYRFLNSGEVLTSRISLRFMDRPAVEGHLSKAGFVVDKLLGDWDSARFDENSAEMIFIAHPARW